MRFQTLHKLQSPADEQSGAAAYSHADPAVQRPDVGVEAQFSRGRRRNRLQRQIVIVIFAA